MKAILNRIEEINNLLPMVANLDEYPTTFAGGTHEHYLILESPIKVQNQFVYICFEQTNYNLEKGKIRYNTNKRGPFDYNGLDALKYTLSIILKSYKKALKN
jgi:hypothetical protein